MGQTLLETLTAKQLVLFTLFVLVATSAFFVIGGTKGADPASANIHIANLFTPDDYNQEKWVWYKVDDPVANEKQKYYNGKIVDLFKHRKNISAEHLVLSSKFPHPGSNTMHRVYQFMLVFMTIQVDFMMENVVTGNVAVKTTQECMIEFNAKLGYSDYDGDAVNPPSWTLLTSVKNQKRPLKCKFNMLQKRDDNVTTDGYYTCEDQYLFELGSVAHKHYILNMQFPATDTNKFCLASETSYFGGLHLTEIHQNGGYTISLFVSKTVMFPFIAAALFFFLRRIRRENREKSLLEKSIFWLGSAMLILLFPIDWLTLVADMPYMLLFSDLRQGLFYTALLVFWCIFSGEHILDQNERNKLASYKYEIGSISVGCLALFIFDCVERGVQLSNPFHTIWKKDAGEKAAKAFLGLAAFASIIYCLFFMRLLYFVYRNIRMKEVALPAMQEDRRLYYQNRIYRFRVLLWVSLFTVVATIVCFVLDQINETTWKFEDSAMNDYVVFSSAMHFGMFGMWGTYVFSVLILYSPSSDGTRNAGPDVQYRRSEHLLHGGDGSGDEDEVNFRHPKT
ncbi:protein wntless homolog [Hydractinia symbiolongicarpus]|uniref:protein wntless homolog n=1 Tax=Hydractinia symbiolongicarpus TaxID=13093 RepID=UPI00255152BF|nr:protein wntless homolog [Hydractinia symbiolongicarpus]